MMGTIGLKHFFLQTLGILIFSTAIGAADQVDLSRLEPSVLTPTMGTAAREMVNRDLKQRRDAVNLRNRAAWAQVKNRQQWEAFTHARLALLKESLGSFPPAPKKQGVRITRKLKGPGYRIHNLLYESRPGQWVPANLYLPETAQPSMPGILIAHSHHRHRMQPELQDMGMTWARQGCMVLVIDQVGYGERRAHPFHSAADYPKAKYKSWRQDYYYRYDSGIQLQLAGDSLMGWMVYDQMRGLDFLLSQKGIDPKRTVILGAVAGGGDPAAITAALDPRIQGAVPFNFGGAQPETKFPLPKDAEAKFNYLGGSYWDSSRGLWRSGRDDFLHWVIVGSIAPRPLIYAHEFAWDKKNDPIWKRFQTIWGFYNATDKLGSANGKGSVRGKPPEATHCTNIGKYHRQFIHPLFQKWYDISVSPKDEFSHRRTSEELRAWTDKTKQELKPQGLLKLAGAVAKARMDKARQAMAQLPPVARRKSLQKQWRALLGTIDPKADPKVLNAKKETVGAVQVERVVLEVEPGMMVPLILLSPTKSKPPHPVVIAMAQAGKAAFLKHRSQELKHLLSQGIAVCLPDLRGTGETKAGTSRGRRSGDGNRSVNLLLHGETMLGRRLFDLRSVLRYLASRKDINRQKLAVWGTAFVEPNPITTDFKIPRDVAGRPRQSEPLGGLMALLTALFEPDLQAVYVHRGLAAFHPVLTSPHVYIPHDVVVPRTLTVGDLNDVAAVIDCPFEMGEMVDHLNRPLSREAVRKLYPSVKEQEPPSPGQWLAARLKKRK